MQHELPWSRAAARLIDVVRLPPTLQSASKQSNGSPPKPSGTPTTSSPPNPRFASDRNGITRTPSPHYASSWYAPRSAGPADARSAVDSVFDTVVIEGGTFIVAVDNEHAVKLIGPRFGKNLDSSVAQFVVLC